MDINGFLNWCICLWNWLAGTDITGCQVMRALFRNCLGGCEDRKMFAAPLSLQIKRNKRRKEWKNPGCIEETHSAHVEIMYRCCMNAFIMLFLFKNDKKQRLHNIKLSETNRSLFIGTNCEESTLVRFSYNTVASPLSGNDWFHSISFISWAQTELSKQDPLPIGQTSWLFFQLTS